ncbi:hypothetical protein D5967_24155 [Salmonella enterica subsp. enterica serovar Brunei]|nr:hypothetical protein [Salmonella enterica subsp. enterica serovar Brunei]EBX9309594.1 hypothetical protein [Salmonella enterica subsp. enterica serovar Brunei]EBX9383601.1 hypothetical protein [Salmonella enterica subsp. enterica serovar Brunei]EBY1279266.1 hypothetical protein [Salmonella enterica subsp. enterica serovar Brunei]EBY7260255.1 hypothetical protein [Salmonella enterica subsp. enterica serovar Brunei]
MMDSLKQRILDYVSANQPAKVDLIYKELGICRNRYYEEAKQLRFMGMLRSVPGIGVFPGEDAYQHWLRNGGYEEIRQRAVDANLSSQEAKGMKKPRNSDDPKMFEPYDPAKNGVVNEFMQSDARKRLMMVYGRGL